VYPSPYRQPNAPEEAKAAELDSAATADYDLVPVFALLWLASIAQVWRSIALGEKVESIDALAGVAIVVLPILVREPLRALFMRGRRGLVRKRDGGQARGIRKS
jgi:hypothetical protein